jgi:hypothetical protein
MYFQLYFCYLLWIIILIRDITGITDGYACFSVSIITNKNATIGWSVSLVYTLVAANNPANYLMLELINAYFKNIGHIITNPYDNTINLKITCLINCLIVRDHFIKYSLFTYKLVHFQLWCMVIILVQSGQHLTWLGLLKIVGIKNHFKGGYQKNYHLIFLFTCPFLPLFIILYCF